ncbi:MAG: hypothetical protein FJW20_22250 [Acidimicrobiia bacterium]|nr:hypothetical protein [Acidimicrobiia bacterium]
MKTAFSLLLILSGFGSAFFAVHAYDDKDKKAERRLQERTDSVAKKLARCQAWNTSDLNRFLNSKASALLERAKTSRADHFMADRLLRAAGELLEASEEVFKVSTKPDDSAPKEKAETARELEKDYFRVQQGDYFAGLSGEADAAAWVKHSRSLYQQARAAYDAGRFRKARRLGHAADAVIDALEYLAQARVRVPEPPRLP